jgi:hypothetical protein
LPDSAGSPTGSLRARGWSVSLNPLFERLRSMVARARVIQRTHTGERISGRIPLTPCRRSSLSNGRKGHRPIRLRPPMTCIASLLAEVAPQLEARLKSQLSGFTGVLVRSYLPQVWVFQTEQETATLTVQKDGRVTAAAGASSQPDVTIATTHDRLSAALRTRDRAQVPPGPLTVTAHTSKGRTAFDFTRSRLGL